MARAHRDIWSESWERDLVAELQGLLGKGEEGRRNMTCMYRVGKYHSDAAN